jgi:hypothetical protein
MSALFEAVKAILNKSIPSWTVWLGLVWAVLSGLPDVLVTVVGWFGEVTPELTAKVVAISLLIARARSIVQPVVEGLLGKK